MIEILTPQEMGEADRLTIENGTPGQVLMDVAGRAIADEVMELMPAGSKILCLAGPGNNGGDGYVALRYLAERNYEVSCFAILPDDGLSGDAKWAMETCGIEPQKLDPEIALDTDLIIDALFGAGLDRPLSGPIAQLINRVNSAGIPVVAADLPSGIDGATGMALGPAIQAKRSVTFFRLKPGHVLMPGRANCGRVKVRQIGISDEVIARIEPRTFHNVRPLWDSALPVPRLDVHKYDHGHAIIVSGGASQTGAARLAAAGALRGGAGLVTLASPPSALLVNAAHLTAVMVRSITDAGALAELLTDKRFNALVMGPGLGVGDASRGLVEAGLLSGAGLVLDADALTSFAGTTEPLWAAIKSRDAPTLLTPHEGEFARLFPDLGIGGGDNMEKGQDKLSRAREAASRSAATIILKGPDTVVAVPDGRASICSHAPPWLATAGSGDVLAGLVGAALAQGIAAFEAASMAVWLHAEAAQIAGPGLIAEDLPKAVARVRKQRHSHFGQPR